MKIKEPWVATREQVKTFLQIEDSSYDALIDTYLPIVSKDIKDITNNLFVVDTTGDVTSGSAIVGNIDVTMIDFGNVFIAEGLERVSVLTINDETITVSANSSVTGTEVDVKINVFPNSKKPVAAAMVMYNIKRYTEVIDFNGPLKSERVGNYTWTGDGGTSAGYPQWMIDALAEITMPRFI
jgi:hypothetical protein